MAGFMYIPRDNSLQNNAFSLLSNLIMQKMAYNQQEEMFNKRSEYEDKQMGRNIAYKAAIEGRDVIDTDAGKIPEGYTQNPYNTTQFIGPQPKYQPRKIMIGGDEVGYIGPDGKFYQGKQGKQGSKIEQYEYAKTNDGYKGSFEDWMKLTKAEPIQISIGEKAAQAAATRTATKEVDLKSSIKTPQFVSDAERAVSNRYGEDWQDLSPWQREEAVFDEVDNRIKESFLDTTVVYGNRNGVRGWYDYKTGKLIRKWDRNEPMRYKTDLR